MKRYFALLIFISMVFCSGIAFAWEDGEATVGLTGWYSSWKKKFHSPEGGNTLDYGSAPLIGPSLSIKAGRIFLDASYLETTKDYERRDVWITKVTLDQKELDAKAGAMIVPHLGAFAGYKIVWLAWTTSQSSFNQGGEGSWKIVGPAVGLLGDVPLSRIVSLYGDIEYFYGKQKAKWGEGSGTIDTEGPSGEAGLAISFFEVFSGKIGFKRESFVGTSDNAPGFKVRDRFSGLSFGLNYTFK